MSDSGSNSPSLRLEAVWKLFGKDVDRMLADNRRTPDMQMLAQQDVVPAVRDVSLEISDDECFVIMGLSGSGKSTLVRCMSRLVEPSSGEIWFRGENLLTVAPGRLIEIRRQHMGMVFQHFALLPHLNVLGNVAFPLEIRGLGRAERERRALEMIELVGLDGREHFYPHELSGGQQQRVGIARSLCGEPDVWFLDEPFSALDPLIRREMQDEFMRLQSVLKKSIVFITHDFDEAIRVADRIAIMKDGAVVQIGTPDELVLSPADEYVAEFTRSVSKSKVIRVEALMQPLQDALTVTDTGGDVRAGLVIADVAPRFLDDTRPLKVIDESGEVSGYLMHEDVIALMMQG